MNIKATRISTASGAGKIGAHVLNGADNEEVHVLHGSPDDMRDMVEDARDVGAQYAMRHVIISPKEAVTRAQAEKIAADWLAEFKADDRPWMLVEHKKARADGSFDKHWHLIVGEVSPSTGRVLDNRADFARHEKLARLAEIELGHQLVVGRHNAAVFHALNAEGRTAEAGAMKHLTIAELPHSAFTSNAFQVAKRKGTSLSQIREQVRSAWERSDDARSFSAALAEQGLAIEQGRKKHIVIGTNKDGQRVEFGSIDRLAKVPNAAVTARMSTQKEDRDDHRGRTERDIRPGQRDENGHNEDHRVVDGEWGRDESTRTDRGNPGRHVEDPEFNGHAVGTRRANARSLASQLVQGGSGTKLQSLAKSVKGTARKAELSSLKAAVRSPTATASVRAAEVKFTAKGGMSKLQGVSAGKNPTAGGGGGKSGKSMEAALHAGTGWIEAPEMSGGDAPPPMHENDAEELSELSQKFWETLKGLGRKLFGGRASDSPPPHVETSPSPPGEGLGTGKPVHAVAGETTPEPRRDPVKAAIQRNPADPAKALGKAIVAYAGMPPGSGFDGLADEYRSRVDALEPHYRESLAGTGRHYPGLQALIDKESMQERSRDYDRVQGRDAHISRGLAFGPR